MNKKTLLIITVIVLALAGIGGGIYLVNQRQEVREKAAPATTISFQPETKETKINDVVNFDILVDTGENSLASVRLDISFDQNILQPVSLSFSSLLPAPLRPVDISQPGKMTGSAGVATGTSISGSGQKIASCSFRVLSTAPSGTTISFGANTLASSATTADKSTNLIIRKKPATVIAAAPPTRSPTAIPTATPTPFSVGVGGDSGEPTAVLTLASVLSPTISPLASTGGEEEMPVSGGIFPTVIFLAGGVLFIVLAFLFV